MLHANSYQMIHITSYIAISQLIRDPLVPNTHHLWYVLLWFSNSTCWWWSRYLNMLSSCSITCSFIADGLYVKPQTCLFVWIALVAVSKGGRKHLCSLYKNIGSVVCRGIGKGELSLPKVLCTFLVTNDVFFWRWGTRSRRNREHFR